LAAFRSLLSATSSAPTSHDEATAIFADLHLDQVVEAAVAGREAYDLLPLFSEPLSNAADIVYRQAASRELEEPTVRAAVDTFARRMTASHASWRRGEKMTYLYQKLVWSLAAVVDYGTAVEGLRDDLAGLALSSEAFRGLREYLGAYAGAPPFRSMMAEARALQDELGRVRYTLLVHGSKITVGIYADQADYSREVERTFARFRESGDKEYRFTSREPPEMNHVEEGIFDLVAELYPSLFLRLRELGARAGSFFDPVVLGVEREVQFLAGFLDSIVPLRKAGLGFCYPSVDGSEPATRASEAFDLALAHRLVPKGIPVVPNDLSLSGPERVLVVTGPNHGGKTTFARAFGQLHYLARLGLPVPARSAHLFRCDRVFTQFEREEHPEDLRGKLKDELIRVRAILERATRSSVLVVNESFSTTSLADARFVGERVLGEVVRREMLAVYVTFVDELASLNPGTVSVVGTVAPDDPTRRTFRLVRAPADGRAYALAIAERYGLTYATLTERLRR
jgi:DNA mismatch repair protein MutS